VAVVLLAASPLAAYEAQIRAEAKYIASKIAEHGKTSVAVIDFADLDGKVTQLGRFMAEEMAVALSASAHSFQVIDRTHIQSLLAEHKLSASGLIDQTTARKLGRITGVDCLVTATLTPLGDSIKLSIKVLDSNSARLLVTASSAIPKTSAIADLMRQGVAGSGGGGLASTPSRSSGSSLKTVVIQDVAITLKGCRRSGQAVTCHLDLINQSRDKNIIVYKRSTRIFDTLGNEYASVRMTLGNEMSRRYADAQIAKRVVNDILIKSSARFEGVFSEVRSLTLFEFSFNGDIVQFKNISIID
jgi:TolB-like protein